MSQPKDKSSSTTPKTTRRSSFSIVTFSIFINGDKIPPEEVYSIQIDLAVQQISKAKIRILDGDPTTGTFAQSSSNLFVPGNKIAIKAGYDLDITTVFEGMITNQEININPEIGSNLIIDCQDVSVKMTVGRKSKTFKKKSDSDIMSSIISNYSGLISTVEKTDTVWADQVQYYTSDWDFIISRAQVNGLVVTNQSGHVEIKKIGKNSKPVVQAEYGDNIMTFQSQLDSVSQLSSVSATSWDFETQNVMAGKALSKNAGAGNLSTKKLSEVVGLNDFQLQSPINLAEADLKNWSEAQILKSEYSKITGKVKIQGNSEVVPASFIKLKGLGDRFNGDHFVSSVQHIIADGEWLTEISFGMSSDWSTENEQIMAPPASGLLPGASGLFNATVKKMHDDPKGQFRILIDIPMFDQTGEGIWARLSNFYASSGAGTFFMPEVGDEVVIGFLNEDPRYPIILGSLYSQPKNQPLKGLIPNEKNTQKAIVSKSQIQIAFDDEQKVLTIKTPSDNTFILNDQKKEITIKDQNSNSLVMSSAGVTIKSANDITLDAGGDVKIVSAEGVDIKSDADISMSSVNMKSRIGNSYEVSSGLKVAIEAGVELKLDAAMIMIN